MHKRLKTFYTDGGTRNNGSFGNQQSFICATDESGKVIFKKEVGDLTNNEAELTAILILLQSVGNKKLQIISDSQLAVNLINKKWLTDINRLLIILRQIWVINKIYEVVWKPREENKAGQILQFDLGI